MNKGFINDRHDDPNAYVFGASILPQDILCPDGQWEKYIPPDEFQNQGNFEPYACGSFGTWNCIETAMRRRYGEIENYSDRYLAKMTGTDVKMGNSPHFVAEYIRLKGGVYENDWPYVNTTFEDFYKTPPPLSDKFLPEFGFGHEYVNSDPVSMKDALRLSPLGVSVYAWALDEDGLYYKPDGARDSHWVMCYGYKQGEYWNVFDSYSNSHKKVKWNTKFEVVKRYHVERTLKSQQQLTGLRQILLNILDWIRLKRAGLSVV